MCNEDLNVVSHPQSSAEPNPVATPVVETEAPPTPQPGKYSNCLCYYTLHVFMQGIIQFLKIA